VIDINTDGGDANPRNLANVNGTLFFVANDDVHGSELWRTDAALGAVLVKDIAAGLADSSPTGLTNFNGLLYFSANDGTHGTELWRSDGTENGTYQVLDIRAGGNGSFPASLVVVNDRLYFAANDGANGNELWQSNGQAAGTTLLADLYSGSGSSSPGSLTNVNGVLYLAAYSASTGTELWRSDGTSGGTVLVKDINPGTSGSTPSSLTAVGNKLFFSAYDATNGTEPWVTNGTEAGTALLGDIYAGTTSSSASSFTAVGDTLFFQANNGINGAELWRSDGTTAGTALVKDIYPDSPGSSPTGLANLNGVLYFAPYGPTTGRELWKSNGTEGGTVLVADIYAGAGNSAPAYLTNVAGTLYFLAYGSTASELWKSDGTTAGTLLVRDIWEGAYSSAPQNLFGVGNRVYFSAIEPTHGRELWQSDGSVGGTTLVADIRTTGGDASPANGTEFNGNAYFAATTAALGDELWTSNGSAAGTALVKDVHNTQSSSCANLTVVDGTLYFSAFSNGNGTELWKTGGTAASTELVKDISSGSYSSYPTALVNLRGALLFTATNGTNGVELWTSDGTAGGTVMLKDINPGSGSSNPANLTVVDGTLFFAASDGTNGTELWKTDGTAAGTTLVKDIHPSGSSSPAWLTNVGGVLYFTAADGASGIELWRSNGSEAGTSLVIDIYPLANSSTPQYLTNFGGRLYFSASNSAGRELWSCDGTADGTACVKDIYAGGSSSNPANLTVAGNGLFFVATEGTYGTELWKSDGTAAGTVLVKDITDGSTSTSFPWLVAAAGRLCFSADDGAHGRELWTSDGSANGTLLAADLRQGSEGSMPQVVTASPQRLYFSASDGQFGRELWVLDAELVPDIALSVSSVSAGAPAGTVVGQFSSVGLRPHDTLTYTLVAGDDDDDNGSFQTDSAGRLLTAAEFGVGSYRIRVRAADEHGGSVEKTFTIAVTWINTPPTVTQPIADFAIEEDAATTAIDLGSVFSDSDVGDVLTYTASAYAGVEAVVSQVSEANYTYVHQELLYTHLGDQKGYNGAQHDPERNNIQAYLTGLGLSTALEPFDVSGTTYYNVVATQAGVTRPDDVYIICCHYDTADKNAPGMGSPGANDNASGVAAVLEAARVLSQYRFEATLKFIAFDREESGCLGSKAYVATHASEHIAGVVNIDMIGSNIADANQNRVRIQDYDGTSAIKPFVMAAFARYVPQIPAYDPGSNSGSDHVSFEQGGFDAVKLGHGSGDPYYHTAEDAVETPGHIDYVYATRVTVGAVGYLAEAAGLLNSSQIVSAAASGSRLYVDYLANQSGAARVTVRATDSHGSWIEDSFLVTIRAVDDAPAGSDTGIAIAGGATYTFVAADFGFSDPADTPPNALVAVKITTTPSAGSLQWNGTPVTAGQTVPASDVALGRLTLTADVNGSATRFTFQVQDDGGSTDGNANLDPTPNTVWINVRAPAVFDLNTSGGDSNPRSFAAVGGTVFFVAHDDALGTELWRTDGTPSGTTLVADICPGLDDSSPAQLVNVNGTLYFAANDGTTGVELWRTDGTASGTWMVKDIRPGESGSLPSSLINFNGLLYFAANDGSNGTELWISNGQAAGTAMLKDIYPGGSASPAGLTNLNGTLYFSATGGSSTGAELWKSNGTAEGTVLVKDICSGSGSSAPASLTPLGSTLFFAASDGVNGIELWKSDGTADGTLMVKDINPSGNANAASLTAVGNTLFFSAYHASSGTELWCSDGSEAGTVLVKDIFPGNNPSNPAGLTNVAGTLYFAAREPNTSTKVWKSDGTTAGTVLVKDLYPGYDATPNNLTNVGGRLFFTATSANGTELWKSDGTAAGTAMVQDIWSGSSSAAPQNLFAASGQVWFSAFDPQHGRELWLSDGTAAGTSLVADLRTSNGDAAPASAACVNGVVYFAAADTARGREVWRSAGTTNSTRLLKDITSGTGSSNPQNLVQHNGVLYFAAVERYVGNELWASNGDSVWLVKDVYPGTASSNPSNLTCAGAILFFRAYTAAHGTELWKTDGTAAGTMLVKDICPGSVSSSLANLTDVNGVLFFTANDGVNGVELWRSDGTAVGTTMVKNIAAAGSSTPAWLTNVGGTLYFAATDGANGVELWTSDGTASGTLMVEDLYSGSGSSSPANLVNRGGRLYFSAADSATGRELWTSNGTSDGTLRVLDILPGTGSSNPANLTVVGNQLFFTATDVASGTELWTSDGTPTGTVLLRDITPGTASTGFRWLAAAAGKLAFAADDGLHGGELWTSDGSPAGTLLWADLRPGPGGSEPQFLASTADRLYLSASDGLVGRELWTVEWAPATPSLGLSCAVVSESSTSNRFVALVCPTGLTFGDTVTYSLVSGEGATDNSAFRVDATGRLTTGVGLDHETRPSCSIRVRAADQHGNSVEQAFTIAVADAEEPPALIGPIADLVVAEDAVPTVIDLASRFADPDAGDQLTYTIFASATIDELVGRVSQANYQHLMEDLLYNHLGDQKGLSGPEHDLARDNIRAYFEALGLPTELEPVVYNGQTTYNVVATLRGTTRPDDVYVIGAHYDTMDNAALALGGPGANDNASGVAAVMEAARVLSQYAFEATIIFVAFDCEEVGCVGSLAFVADHAASRILGMINLERIARNSAGANAVYLYDYDGVSANKPIVLSAMHEFCGGLAASDSGISASSDHRSFEQGGFDAVCVMGATGTDIHYHMPTDSVDTPDHIDYAYATKISAGVIGYLARAAGLQGTAEPVAATIVDDRLQLAYAPNLSGTSKILVRAFDSSGAWAEDYFAVTVTAVNDAPVIASLAARPNPVGPEQTLTLTATGVADPADRDGSVTRVTFYRESNGTPGLQIGTEGDLQLGIDLDPLDGWSLDVSVMGLPAGVYTFYAQATDNQGGVSVDGSSAATATSTVQTDVSLDADGNGTADALTDGILILRYLFAPSGAWNFADAVGVGAARTTRTEIKSLLDRGLTSMLDVDGNGTADALTDGILILRYLFAPSGGWNFADAVGVGATRTTREAIKAFLDQYNPAIVASSATIVECVAPLLPASEVPNDARAASLSLVAEGAATFLGWGLAPFAAQRPAGCFAQWVPVPLSSPRNVAAPVADRPVAQDAAADTLLATLARGDLCFPLNVALNGPGVPFAPGPAPSEFPAPTEHSPASDGQCASPSVQESARAATFAQWGLSGMRRLDREEWDKLFAPDTLEDDQLAFDHSVAHNVLRLRPKAPGLCPRSSRAMGSTLNTCNRPGY
jgi:ELWxxDGT repeat protein